MHAIVIGSGMGGLAAAQVLSKQFSSVQVLERDHAETVAGANAVEVARGAKAVARPGVMQVSRNICADQANTV